MRSSEAAKFAFPFVVTVCVIAALALPSQLHQPGTMLGGVAELLVSPLSGPITWLRDSLRPIAPPPEAGTLAAMEQTLQETRTQLLQTLDENQRLAQTIERLGVLRGINASPVELLPATIVGTSADTARPTMTLRAGASDGIEVGSVVTLLSNPSQLLGLVKTTRAKTSTIAPITTFGAGELDVAIIPAGAGAASDPATWLRARIAPAGDGTLRGDLEDRKDQTGKRIEPKQGDEVRLLDGPGWPTSARMLVVGEVRGTAPSPRQPLRLVVTVAPTIKELTRVREVMVRLPLTRSAPSEGGTP
jgi:cell shape-determining protein MreC